MRLGVNLATLVWPGSARLRVVAIALLSQLTTACVVPGHMHVTNGIAPQEVDKNVRFRTTYYFRVFDYCYSANATIDGGEYRKIVPETDTLYRYRMSGQASALGNQIHFESGTLQQAQIDPFGSNVTYNSDIGGFLYRSREAAALEAKAAQAARVDTQAQALAADQSRARSLRALDEFNSLAAMLKPTTDPASPDEGKVKTRNAAIGKAMEAALDRYLGPVPQDEQTKADIEAVNVKIRALVTRVDTLEAETKTTDTKTTAPPDDRLVQAIDAVKADVAHLKTRIDSLPDDGVRLGKFCSLTEVQRRGFQIMGPEGMRPFDQESRLILAMHSSAKPLIDTLSEYSSRLLRPQVNANDQLLPLARETIRIVETQRSVDRVAVKVAEGGATPPKVADVFATAADAFAGASK